MITVTKSDYSCTACSKATPVSMDIYSINLSSTPNQAIVVGLCSECIRELMKKVQEAKKG